MFEIHIEWHEKVHMISCLNSIYSVILALFYTGAYSHTYIERGS